MQSMLREKNIGNVFHILCATAAISLSIFWIHNYCKNEDLCQVDYKIYYENKNDEFPVLSICFENFISQEKLNTLNRYVNLSNYQNFLKGDYFEPDFLEIDHKAVTRNINESVVSSGIAYRNGTYKKDFNNTNVLEDSFVGSWTYDYSGIYNCFSLKIPPSNEIEIYQIKLNSTVFPNSKRARFGGFVTLLHFPKQFLVASETIKYSWQKREKYDRFVMKFKINAVEVIKRRPNGRKLCYKNWKAYDDFILLEHLKNIGCTPPYLHSNQNYPKCNNIQKIKESQFYIKRNPSDMPPPCKAMEKIHYTYEEEDSDGTSQAQDGVFMIKVWFSDQKFKEISQTRYYFKLRILRQKMEINSL